MRSEYSANLALQQQPARTNNRQSRQPVQNQRGFFFAFIVALFTTAL